MRVWACGWTVRPGGEATGQGRGTAQRWGRGGGTAQRGETAQGGGTAQTTLWGKACGGHGLGPLEGGESPTCWAVLLGWSPSPSKCSAAGEAQGLCSPLSLGC